MSAPEIRVTPSEVRQSAAPMDAVAHRASSSRDAVADEMSGHTSAWQAAGRAGFANFIGILQLQADRLRADLGDLADKLRVADHAYEDQELESSAALDNLSTL